MKKKTLFNLFVAVLTFMFIVCYITVPSNAKFIRDVNAPFEGEHTLDYTVNEVLEVNSQEELFAAINNGYSFIQINKNVDNPLIVTQKAENLNSDLILDLNGIEIQRNGPDPILNISPGVRLTIMDTSEEKTGGLYNPVGSVFNINGGILTVATGVFESGPRYSEYYSYNSTILDNRNGSTTKRTLLEQNTMSVTYYDNVFDANGNLTETKKTTNKKMPIIRSYPIVTGDITYTHGNLYFDQSAKVGGVTIKADTYCYYQTSEDAALGAVSPATADWYYTYYVKKGTYEYVSENLPSGDIQDYMRITVYGYENAISKAKQIADPSDYYAAIQMQSGSLEVKNGGFYSYFGLDTTACVNAMGGSIAVTQGSFSSRIPDATVSTANSVDKKKIDKEAFDEEYFTNFIWRDGALAKSGEANCILSGGNAVVSVETGAFYSSNNNIVNMNGGELMVGGGSFGKKNTASLAQSSKTAAVYMQQGVLSVSNATFDVKGDYDYGVYMLDGTLDLANTSFDVEGENTYGVYLKEGELTVDGGAFNVNGNTARGVYMEDGTLDIIDGSISTTGANTNGVYMQNGTLTFEGRSLKASCKANGENAHGIYLKKGDLVTNNADYIVTGAASRGVYMEDGTLDIESCTFEIEGNDAYGVYSTVSGNDKFTVSDTSFALSNGSRQVGVYTANGKVVLKSTTNQNSIIEMSGDSATAVKAENGGSVSSTKYDYTLSGSNSTGIHAKGGSVDVTNGNVMLSSNESCYGVYASSTGSVGVDLMDVTINVGYSITGNKTNNSTNLASVGVFLASNDASNKIALTNTNVRCYEVGILIDGGSLEVYGSGSTNDISTRKASSIIVKGGSINFDATCDYNITSSTTRNDNVTNRFNITLPTLSGSYVAYANTDGIYVSDGKFNSDGNVNITHAGLRNNISNWQSYLDVAMTSFAVRVEGGEVTLTKAHITNSVGGGVMCNGGDVTLGKSDSLRSDITVETTGSMVDNTSWLPINRINNFYIDESWYRYKTQTGGNAIEINGGNLIVYEGTYTAAYGDGIYLKAADTGDNKASVDIYNGSFTGLMTNDQTNQDRSGPAGSYGVKVYGLSVINIYDGEFNGQAGVACVGGVSSYNYSTNRVAFDSNKKAEVYIYKGQFGNKMTPNDGFMIYDNSRVIFGAGGADIASSNAITFNAALSCFSINWFSYDTNYVNEKKSCDVRVYYGTYNNGRFIGWNKGGEASQTNVYNDNNLTIRTYNSGAEYSAAVNVIKHNGTVYYS